MASPGEIDLTEPGRDGAGAEGGAVGGDSTGDSTLPPPLQPPQDIDRTNPFQPQGSSTPYPSHDNGEAIELATMNLDEMGLPPDEVPLLSDFLAPDEQQKAIDETNRLIQDKFPQADFSRLDPIGFGKKPENQGELVTFSKGKGGKYGETRVLKKDGTGLLKAFTDKFKKALGPRAEEVIAQDNQDIREGRQKVKAGEQDLREKEQQQNTLEQRSADNIQHLERRLEQTQAKIAALDKEPYLTLSQQNELDRLKQLERNLKTDLENEKVKGKQLQTRKDKILATAKQALDKAKSALSTKTKQRDETELGLNRTKPLTELEERYETLKRANDEDQLVIDDDNASADDIQAAAERILEREEEMERLAPQIQEREEALPLRERVKNIFKKYGWTLQAVALAVGVVLSALALAGLNGLKAGTKAVGKGLKAIGQKLGSLLAKVCQQQQQCWAVAQAPGLRLPACALGLRGGCLGGLTLLGPPSIRFSEAFFVP